LRTCSADFRGANGKADRARHREGVGKAHVKEGGLQDAVEIPPRRRKGRPVDAHAIGREIIVASARGQEPIEVGGVAAGRADGRIAPACVRQPLEACAR
jgi:hypothetical protein